MYDIKLACCTTPWGRSGFVQAIKDIAEGGFDGVEYANVIIRDYFDRLHVFQEILGNANLQLVNLIQEIDLLDKENADLQIERGLASARFITAAGARIMTVCHEHLRDAPLTDDEWATAGAMLEELAERSFKEYNITVSFMPRQKRLIFHEKDICRLLAATNKQYVKLTLDTAEITLAGCSPQKIIKNTFERIKIVRLHDVSASKRRQKFISDKSSTPQFGRGAVDFDAICKLLANNNYHGWIVLDVSGTSSQPAAAMLTGYRYLMRHSGLFEV